MTQIVADSRLNHPPSTLVELLRYRASSQATHLIYTFLADGETEEYCLSYKELDRRARTIGARLQQLSRSRERALLLYPPGLDYIAGFFGCLYTGVIAVPAYPPDPFRIQQTLPRLQMIAADAQATTILTTTSIMAIARHLFTQAPDLEALHWLTTDDIPSGLDEAWQEPGVTGESLAFLQYTSGSTRAPRGVMLSHYNLLHNLALIKEAMTVTPDTIVISWLPPYHDMGLIGTILQPLYASCRSILMSPLHFLQRPFRWLQAVSRYRGTISGGPNFSFDLCVRKIKPEQRAGLDLSSWRVAFNGAEPVRAQTLENFTAAFEPCGFHPEAFYPCYGLAEATLMVSGGSVSKPPAIHAFKSAALEQNQIIPVKTKRDMETQKLVGCGHTLTGQKILIVDPETRIQSPPGQVGEIWVSGPSVAQGYWNKQEETKDIFNAYLANDDEDGPFLRTGDLGCFWNGELLVSGRIKDLIILDGLNHYPQDIEQTVEKCHHAIRPGCSAAFSIEINGQEKVVVVAEVAGRKKLADQEIPAADALIREIRRAVASQHDIRVHDVVLLQTRSIAKTSSGKIQRHACKAGYLAGTLEEWRGE